MAFTVEGEYERLMKIQAKSPNNQIPFECGVACGIVTRIEYIPRTYNNEVHMYLGNKVNVYVIAGWEKDEQLAFTITMDDVCKRYQDRKYRYNKQYGILEYYPNK